MDENKKNDNTMLIVLINIVILIIYTLLLKPLLKGEFDFLAILALLAIQFGACIILAVFYNTKAFLLSAAIIFLIGFSTCYYSLHTA